MKNSTAPTHGRQGIMSAYVITMIKSRLFLVSMKRAVTWHGSVPVTLEPIGMWRIDQMKLGLPWQPHGLCFFRSHAIKCVR